jgi:membrane protease subunit HflK
MRNRFDEDSTPDLKVVVAHYRDNVRKRLRWLGPVFGGVLVLLILISGLYSVEPGEVGVVRTFGRETGQTQPGLHFAMPIAQRVDIVNISKVRRAEIGFRSVEGGTKRVDHEALMLTGDENIVEAQMIVQYRISEPSKWLFKLKDSPVTLHIAAEVALRGVVGQTIVASEEETDPDSSAQKREVNPKAPNTTGLDILTTGRDQAQVMTKKALQELMDLYESGVKVTEVKLQVVDAPDEVKDAFHDVVRAREEREQKINKARGYREDRLPRARGEAQKIMRASEAYKRERVLRAEGEAARFTSVLAEYEKARAVTRVRLHLETMERILGRVQNKVLVDEKVAKNALPLLSLDGRGRATAAAVAGGQP